MPPEEPLSGKPVSPADQALIDAYHQEPVKAAERFVDLAKELLKLELAIPGIYAIALRLVSREQSTSKIAVFSAFALWLIALVLTLLALFPREYNVLDSVIRYTQKSPDEGLLSVEQYFQRSAQFKQKCLLGAVLLFFAGIGLAALTVFI
jgi:hypothetical protein